MNARKRSNNSSKDTELANPDITMKLFRDFDSVFENFDRSFGELIAPLFPFTTITRSGWDLTSIRQPVVDLADEGDHYSVTAELPGFNKDQVEVQVSKDQLLVKAKRSSENEQKGKNYLRQERGYAAFERRISFPEEVDPSKAEANMKNGVLHLTISKNETKSDEKLHKVSLK